MQDYRALVQSAVAAGESKDKCFGVVKAVRTIAAASTKYSKYSGAGQTKVDNDPNDFKHVAKGGCEKMGGSLNPAGDMMKK